MEFFFDSANRNLQQKYPLLYKKRGGNRFHNKTKHIIDGYGWLNTIYELAREGIFTKGTKHNAIECVENEQMDIIFTFLSWKSAQADYEVANAKLRNKEERQKQKMNTK